ncbi:MAG TPA: TetR/AcrR family transcriptional regulator [Gemmatirosa sp.]
MSNNSPARVRQRGSEDRAEDVPVDLDPRAARTTRALGRALITLLEERAFDAITVQDILDRAGVGRTTFYAHYRNKHDVLYSSYEGVFASLEPLVERPVAGASARGDAEPDGRLFPVAEFLAHVGDVRTFVDALRRDGLLDDAWAMLVGYAARMIARRLEGWSGLPAGAPHPLLARMLAGALVESVRWWQDHPAAATPAEVDAAFHGLARRVLQRPVTGGAATRSTHGVSEVTRNRD